MDGISIFSYIVVYCLIRRLFGKEGLIVTISVLSKMENKIVVEIERIREQMVELGIRHGFLHPKVQACSRELDELLLQYYNWRRLDEHTAELAN